MELSAEELNFKSYTGVNKKCVTMVVTMVENMIKSRSTSTREMREMREMREYLFILFIFV